MIIYKGKLLMGEREYENIQRKSVDEGRRVWKYAKEKC